ncbi:NYN domain-containing protein [Lachnospiraceae bacterium OttesenSCG-928-D06]|nr:NYN domain-containing protein [Lachnospiraceae bacterium OttesenSCG-928-D06]
MDREKRIAVLIDAENVSPKYAKLIMDEVSNFGIATYKRIYGDFTQASVLGWSNNLKEYAITPIFQCNYTKGKSASDAALIIDAMDILYSENVEGFCLVTSDSDFTKLGMRLRESGMMVIGMGEKKTPNSLVTSCETFKFLDVLYKEDKEDEERLSKQAKAAKGNILYKDMMEDSETDNIPNREEIEKEIISIIEANADDDGWIDLSDVGNHLNKRIPGFDPRNYKYQKLNQLIESFKSLEVKMSKNPHNKILKIVYVRIL